MARTMIKTGWTYFMMFFYLICFLPNDAESKESGSTVITVPTAYSGPGEPVKGETEQKICRALIKKINKGEDVTSYFANIFVVMPGFYSYLEKKGQALLDKHPEVVIAVPDKSGGFVQYKGGAISKGNIKKCFSSKVFREKFKRFENASIRPANINERKYFYALISFEIKGKPLTAIEETGPEGKPKACMLIFMEEAKIFMIDCML